ncbi:R-spondin-1 isoform X3 [Phycodurus eques]|uniref:R-spondin-1 isoform X3 n=1 Tax=Phycodurus eques TaxID=693459 RepID=UPI002ACE7945|nr:R-spondin-1 isoform X3 [Phycodurus eques]
MQLGWAALVMVFLSTMGDSDVGNLSKTRKPRRASVGNEGLPSCPKGCERCSEYNGCIKCKAKLFIYLERNDIQQVGVCLTSCPMGYFGMRNPEGNNRCTQCQLSEWSQWGSCMKRNKTCGFKKGSQSRVRLPLQHPRKRDPPSGALQHSQPCTPQTERRKCVMAKTPCVSEKTRGGRLENVPRIKEGGSSGGGGGGRRRKAQSRTTVVPNVTSSSVT